MRSEIGRSFLTLLAVCVAMPPALAGGYPVECYRHVQTRPLYGSVDERVELYPATTDVQVSAPIVGTRRRWTEISPETTGERVVPARYRTIRERVLLEPAGTVERRLPPRTEIRYRTESVPASYHWEWRTIGGRRVLCRIRVPAHDRKVAERVAVGPDRIVREKVPAVYGYRDRVIEIAPERRERYVIPARYSSEIEQVVLRPRLVRETPVAPAYRTITRKVLLRPGEDAYERILPRCAP